MVPSDGHGHPPGSGGGHQQAEGSVSSHHRRQGAACGRPAKRKAGPQPVLFPSLPEDPSRPLIDTLSPVRAGAQDQRRQLREGIKGAGGGAGPAHREDGGPDQNHDEGLQGGAVPAGGAT